MKLYSLYKYGTTDPNKIDYTNYNRFISSLPKEMEPSFAKILGIEGTPGHTILRQELITDFDDAPSKTLADTGRISDKNFWKTFEGIVEKFVENDIPMTDLDAGGILVRRISPNQCIPVLYDYKKMTPRTRPFQPFLWIKMGRKANLLRHAERIRKAHMG